MKEILLNDLPRYSPWPAKLLSDAYCPCGRDLPVDRRQNMLREYEQDKYAPLLRYVKEGPEATAKDVVLREVGNHRRIVAGTIDEKLYAGQFGEFRSLMEERLLTQVNRAFYTTGARTIVDLGCGWGYLLTRLREFLPEASLRGGDLSPSAVAVGNMLDYGLEVDEFDFYGDGCVPLEKAESPVLVVTSYALHQLDSASTGVRVLMPYQDKIAGCLSFEPIEDFYDDSILGLLRKRYQATCGYSADLIAALGTFAKSVEIRDIPVANSIGINALLPGSFISWGFR